MNDEMVALLKSGRINNRLLCELATHKDFIKFLADIEIYVDGIATMQIQNLNACLLYTSLLRFDILRGVSRVLHIGGICRYRDIPLFISRRCTGHGLSLIHI